MDNKNHVGAWVFFTHRLLYGFVTVITLFALGCTRDNNATASLSVVSDIIPIAQLIGDVVGEVDTVTVQHVIPNGIDLHSYSMRPSDLVTLENADVIITIGSFFVDIDSIAQNLASTPILIDLTEIVDVIESTDTHHDEHRHNNGSIDPHIWLIPDNLIIIANYMAQTLQEIDTNNRDRYEAQLDMVVENLNVMAQLFRNSFSNCTIPYLVTDHNAFGYYQHEYGLQTEALGHVEHAQVASTKDVRRLIDTINTHNIPLIFNVYGTHDSAIVSIAKQTSAQVATLYHMESFPTNGAVQTYIEVLQYNHEVISTNLDCGTI